MAVKVGNSWVSEAALSYAKVKADSGESATLNGLLDRYPGACRFPCESGRNDHQCGWQCERLGDHGRR